MLKNRIALTALIVGVMLSLSMAACNKSKQPEGLAEAGGGDGPEIVFDPLTKPIPEVPFPNDIATVLDKSTVTGRRLNVGEKADTKLEEELRRHMNKLDGFGTFMPITVKFTKRLNLKTVNDKTILLVKLESPNAGHKVPLDLGRGFFPVRWRPSSPWWRHDPLANANNLLFPEDNTADIDGDTVEEFLNFYELETDTLIARPLVPLEEASRYAVVILRGMKGANGEPVKSPFEYINHTMQTEDLKPLEGILRDMGIPLSEVAFCWSFTTQSVSPDWERIWNGLYNGKGPLAHLAKDYKPVLKLTDLQFPGDEDGNKYTLDMDKMGQLLKFLLDSVGMGSLSDALDFRYIDYMVFGHFDSPSFFTSLDFGNSLSADAHYFSEDMLSGDKKTNTLEPNWIIMVPKDEDMGLDGCQSQSHPQGCADFEEPGAKGADGGFGFAGVDDNGDGWIDDKGEYLTPGSDDVADPAGDNYDPVGNPNGTQGNGILDMDLGPDGGYGVAGVDDDNNGIIDDNTEFQWPGSDDGITEDANGDGRLNTPPFPVAFYGHGHTMAAIESIGYMSAIAQYGLALCSMDAFGHGPMKQLAGIGDLIKDLLENTMHLDIDVTCDASAMSGDCTAALAIVQMMGADVNGDGSVDAWDMDGLSIREVIDAIMQLGLFRVLTSDGRAYDVDGDTVPDSGEMFFTSNVFQTRDTVRQTAIDYMEFTRIVDNFGVLSVNDIDGDTVPDMEGDFNMDGQYDMGGPPEDNPRGHFYLGSSLGGIMGAVNMGVNPRILVGAPVSGAGGLPDVITRSHQTSATRPTVLQLAGPLVVGDTTALPGVVSLSWDDDPASEFFAYLTVPPEGRVRLTNLKNGDKKTVVANPDGTFSIGVSADVGDMIRIESLDDPARPNDTVLALAPYKGMGLDRNTPDIRRFQGLSHTIIARGDPINLAPHYFSNDMGKPMANYPDKGVLIINTVGDANVPMNTGNALPLAAGMMTVDQVQPLVDRGLYMGYVPEPWGSDQYAGPLFDPEDLDDDGLECGFPAADPRCDTAADLAPFPVVPAGNSGRVGAIRWSYVRETGHHAFALPGDRNHGIDWGLYMANQIGYFFASDGTCVIDDPYELHASMFIHPGDNMVLDTTPAGDDHVRTARILKTLGVNPCDYPFTEIDIITFGENLTQDTTPAGDDFLVDWSMLYRGP